MNTENRLAYDFRLAAVTYVLRTTDILVRRMCVVLPPRPSRSGGRKGFACSICLGNPAEGDGRTWMSVLRKSA
jgi:hypothetical protein